MANPYRASLALTAAVTNGIALSQSLGSAGNLTLNGSLVSSGVANLVGAATTYTARRVGITSAGNDSGITWTITGKDRGGNVVSEVLAGANATTANSARDYAYVTSIKGSGATASTVTAGTSAIGSTEWHGLDIFRANFNVGLGVTVSGTVTYNVEQTMDDPNAALPGSLEPLSFQPPNATAVTGFSAQTGNVLANSTIPVFAMRLTVTSGTGTAVLQLIQSGLKG